MIAQSTFDGSAADGRNSHAHGFDCSTVLDRSFGLYLHEASGDKLEDLGGESRNKLSVGAAMWRVSEQLEHPAMSQTEGLRGHVGLPHPARTQLR